MIMKRKYIIIFQSLVIIGLLLSGTTDTMAQGKKRQLTERDTFSCKVNDNEYLDYDDYEQQWNIYRTVPGLVAKNVMNVWTCNDDDKVFLSCKKNEIREIDFSHWTGRGNMLYKSSLVDGEAKEIFSMGSRKLLIRNEQGELYYTGYGKCDAFWKHNTKEDCNSDNKVWKKVKVLDGVKKCWSSQNIFAYVKDNSLHIINYNVKEGKMVECWERKEQDKTYLQGAGEQVEAVIVSESEVITDSCIFARMKDGSVWAMGKNKYKMFGDKKEKYVEDFEKIISKDVIKVGVCEDRVAILKKDKSLWMWGREMKKGTGKCVAKPYKVTDNVKEFTINGSADYCHMLILKTNGIAYGLGGKGYVKVFAGEKTKRWYAKPVKIMEKVKHIYSSGTIYTGGGANTFLLTRKKELYWMGKISCYRPFYQWAEGKAWNLKLKRVPMNWTLAFKKMIGAYQ